MFETNDAPPRDEATSQTVEFEEFDLDAIDPILASAVSAEEEIGGRRDRALTFVRRLSRAQMDHLGLLTGDAKRDEARAGINRRGPHRPPEGRHVSVSFRSNHYSGRARYAGSAYTYRIVPEVVRELARAGWIALRMAPVGQNAAKGANPPTRSRPRP